MHVLLSSVVSSLIRALESRGPGLDGSAVAVLVAALRADYSLPSPEQTSDSTGISRLRSVFALAPEEVELLAIGAAPDLERNLGLAMGMLLGTPRDERPTVALALELAGLGSLSPEARGLLGPDSALIRHGLIELAGDGLFLSRRLRVPDRVVAHLLGDEGVDPLAARLQISAIPLPVVGVEQLAATLQVGCSFCYLHARPGSAGVSMAAAAFEALDIPYLAVDLRRRGVEVKSDVALLVVLREAGLLGRGLILTGVDAAAEEDPLLLDRIAAAPVPVVAIGARRWEARWLQWLPLCLEAPVSTPEMRAAVWRRALGDVDSELAGFQVGAIGWADLLALNIGPEEVFQVVDSAALAAQAQGRAVTLMDLRHTTRRLGGQSTHGGLHRREPSVGFDDLVLPADTLETLQELVGWARNRDTVLAQGPITGKGSKGRGIIALFGGSPGTGKTLAAQVVASSLGLDLQTVDLSAIVDKYIGETEKNLENVFQQAEAMNCVLFFDEADALFGSRSDVRDAKDRYANQEVAYLLQRIEQFDGIAILATNLRGNLDPAFSRRLHFIISFPDPDRETRRRLWASHLDSVAQSDPLDLIDIEALSDHFELAGGDIRNVVMAATFNAAFRGELLGMKHIKRAVAREYTKLARMMPPAGVLALQSSGDRP